MNVLHLNILLSIAFIVDQFEMSLDEFYRKVTNQELPMAMQSTFRGFREPPKYGAYQQSDSQSGEDQPEAIKDSIHMDWTSLRPECPECGVNVRVWDGFAHRLLWNHTWFNSVAFQPLSMRFETGRWDMPIEGFAFRLWTWDDPKDTFTLGKNKQSPASKLENHRAYSTGPYKHYGIMGQNELKSRQESSNDNGDDEDEDDLSMIYKSDRNNQMFMEDEPQQQPQITTYDIINNILPFGHPNLGGGKRH